MGTASVQGPLWGARAQDWADIQEGQSAVLFEAILERAGVGDGTKLLDVGCGAGTLCAMAAKRGANVSGFDASENLLAIARERMPGADFRQGDMEDLPYPDNFFDVVTGVNSFQFAASSENALREAGRVTRDGGLVAIAVWGRPQECEADAMLDAVFALLPPPPAGKPASTPLWADGALEALAERSGLRPVGNAVEVDCPWDYPDEQTAVRGILSSALSTLAVREVGEEKVRETIAAAITPFRKPSGAYRIRNRFLFLAAAA